MDLLDFTDASWKEKCTSLYRRRIRNHRSEFSSDEEWLYHCLLTSRIEDICPDGSLPSLDMSEVHEKVFQGNFLVQVDNYSDINKPLGKERQDDDTLNDTRQRRGNNSNPNSTNVSAGADIKPTRMLKLALNDGKRKAYAIEYQTLADWNEASLFKGAKVLLSDAIVRRGLILLTPSHAKLLGGGKEANAMHSGDNDVHGQLQRQEQIDLETPRQNPPSRQPPVVEIEDAPRQGRTESKSESITGPPRLERVSLKRNVVHVIDLDQDMPEKMEFDLLPTQDQNSSRSLSLPRVPGNVMRKMIVPFLDMLVRNRLNFVKALVADIEKFSLRSFDGQNHSYEFKVIITDGRRNRRANIDDKFAATRLFGMNAGEFNNLRKTNKAEAKRIKQSVAKKLKVLEGIMQVYVSTTGDVRIKDVQSPCKEFYEYMLGRVAK